MKHVAQRPAPAQRGNPGKVSIERKAIAEAALRQYAREEIAPKVTKLDQKNRVVTVVSDLRVWSESGPRRTISYKYSFSGDRLRLVRVFEELGDIGDIEELEDK